MLSRISIVLAFLCNDSNTPLWTLNFFVNGEKDLHSKKNADLVTSLYLTNIAINIPRSMTDYQLILKTTTTILTTSSLIMPSTSIPIIELCLYLTSVYRLKIHVASQQQWCLKLTRHENNTRSSQTRKISTSRRIFLQGKREQL